MIATATSTIWYGSHRQRQERRLSDSSRSSQTSSAEQPQRPEDNVVDASTALLFPVMASLSLLAMFFLFRYLSACIVVYIVVAGVVAIRFSLLEPLRSCITRPGRGERLATYLSIAATASWICSGWWVLNDLIALSLCVLLIATVRLPNLRVATLCLCSLIVYDAFWVFASPFMFKKNVMVHVATTAAASPMQRLALLLRMPFLTKYLASELQLPFKLVFPASGGWSFLGVGDVALPGLLLAMTLAFDDFLAAGREKVDEEEEAEEALLLQKGTADPELGAISNGAGTQPSVSRAECDRAAKVLPARRDNKAGGYFCSSLTGYVVGLLATLVCSSAFDAAQPALIYLVPGVLLPLLARGYRSSHLALLWAGFEPVAVGASPAAHGSGSGSGGGGGSQRRVADGEKDR